MVNEREKSSLMSLPLISVAKKKRTKRSKPLWNWATTCAASAIPKSPPPFTKGESWVDLVFENPLQYDAPSVLTAMYSYTVQLFMDFSGYSDLVIGMAMLLGFRLPENFNMPLRAYNIRDFWDRWHITLST